MWNMIETNQNWISKVILAWIIKCMEYFHITRISYKNLKLFIIYKSSYKYKKEMREMVYYEKEFIKNVIDWMYGC